MGIKGNKRQTGIFFRYSHEEKQEIKRMFLNDVPRKVLAARIKCHINTLPKLRRLLGIPPYQKNPTKFKYEIRDYNTGEVLVSNIKGIVAVADICCRQKDTIIHHISGRHKSTSYKNRKVKVIKI